jgi:shikimate kinase
MNLFLIGYRGTGKTTVAELVAQQLHWPWSDADAELEGQAGRSIAEIFAGGGETEFRDLESDVIRQLSHRDETVIALGGGAVLRELNRDIIADHGRVVWLQSSPEVIRERLVADASTRSRRPQLTPAGSLDEIENVLRHRTPIYAGCADYTVATDGKSPAEVAALIVTWYTLDKDSVS